MEGNMGRFAGIYTRKLKAAIERDPMAYMNTPEQAGMLAEKMTASFAAGRAHLSPASKATAREIGIKPTIRDIRAFLNAPSEV